MKNIDLTTFPFKLFNFNVCDLIVLEGKLMVTTTEGDVVEVNLQNKTESSVNIVKKKKKIHIKTKKIARVFFKNKKEDANFTYLII